MEFKQRPDRGEDEFEVSSPTRRSGGMGYPEATAKANRKLGYSETSRNFMQTGEGTSRTVPVGEREPAFWLILNITMLFES